MLKSVFSYRHAILSIHWQDIVPICRSSIKNLTTASRKITKNVNIISPLPIIEVELGSQRVQGLLPKLLLCRMSPRIASSLCLPYRSPTGLTLRLQPIPMFDYRLFAVLGSVWVLKDIYLSALTALAGLTIFSRFNEVL